MLHAVIRNRDDAMHFLAEVNAYNLKTLEQHARAMARSCETVVDIELDPADRDYLIRRGQRWMQRLANLDGVSVNIAPRQ
jgi:hypothetical protein